MFVSKKEFNALKEKFEALAHNHNELTKVVLEQQEEIYELKKPKEPSYMA